MTISLVRHARAGSRSRWEGPDADRPLDPSGRDRANALVTLLTAERPSRVISSRYLRCTQTVGPLAATLGLHVEVHDALAEGASTRAALALVDALAAAGTTAVLCSHGDVIPSVLDALERRGVPFADAHQCAKGSVWQLAVDDGRVTGARYLAP